jgi:pimeloyl-ACP methyl ester carboxylesterase
VVPEVRYARSGDVSIAYQIIGDGPFDLVWTPGALSHLELRWADEGVNRFYRGLSSFSRLIVFDKRGTGLSDRVAGIADLETRMDDIRAVMDAAGSESAAICGFSEGGPMALLFAATYPERAQALARRSHRPGPRGARRPPHRGVRGPGWEGRRHRALDRRARRGAGVAGRGAPLPDVRDLLAGSGIEFVDRGGAELKGVPGEWQLYAVAAA